MGERMLGLGFEDVVEPGDPARYTEVDATALAITVGRVDWTAFPWADHEQAWSPWVRDTGRDFVAEAIAAAGDRDVSLIVDVLVEAWIARDPSIAGVDAGGEVSTEFASIAALAGAVGDAIVELVRAAAEYAPQAITLTELFLDRWTFGDTDLPLYRAFAGVTDWPRSYSGAIDESHASIGAWRADAVTSLVRRCAAASDIPIRVEVRAQWEGPTNEHGQDYAALLTVADRLVIWGYFALAGREPAALERLAREAPQGSTISIGLWTPRERFTPTELRRALEAAEKGGATSVEVVPMSLMNDELWRALRVQWNAPR